VQSASVRHDRPPLSVKLPGFRQFVCTALKPWLWQYRPECIAETVLAALAEFSYLAYIGFLAFTPAFQK